MNKKIPLVLIALLLVAAIMHLAFGRVRPGFGELVDWVFSTGAAGEGNDAVAFMNDFTFRAIRFPRMLVAVFGGAALVSETTSALGCLPVRS